MLAIFFLLLISTYGIEEFLFISNIILPGPINLILFGSLIVSYLTKSYITNIDYLGIIIDSPSPKSLSIITPFV